MLNFAILPIFVSPRQSERITLRCNDLHNPHHGLKSTSALSGEVEALSGEVEAVALDRKEPEVDGR